MNQFDREEQQLENDYAAGLISHAEYSAQMRQLQREYRWAAEEAAREAYERELDRW